MTSMVDIMIALMGMGITDTIKAEEIISSAFGKGAPIIEFMSDKTQNLLLSYGVYDYKEQVDVLTKCGFPNKGWEEHIEEALGDTLVTKFVHSNTPMYAEEGFSEYCESFLGSKNEDFEHFISFLLNEYGSGASYKDFELKHFDYSVALSLNKRARALVSKLGDIEPRFIFDTLLSIGNDTIPNDDEALTHCQRIIRNGVT